MAGNKKIARICQKAADQTAASTSWQGSHAMATAGAVDTVEGRRIGSEGGREKYSVRTHLPCLGRLHAAATSASVSVSASHCLASFESAVWPRMKELSLNIVTEQESHHMITVAGQKGKKWGGSQKKKAQSAGRLMAACPWLLQEEREEEGEGMEGGSTKAEADGRIRRARRVGRVTWRVSGECCGGRKKSR